MKHNMPKKLEVNEVDEVKSAVAVPVISEKEKLQALHKQLTDLGVNRISQLENLIARAE